MFHEYLIRCGVILHFIPPTCAPVPADLPSPSAIVETVEFVPRLDHAALESIAEIRARTGLSATSGSVFERLSGDNFEQVLRTNYGTEAVSASNPGQPRVQLLRNTGARLDRIANQLEWQGKYSTADELRQLGQKLREQAR